MNDIYVFDIDRTLTQDLAPDSRLQYITNGMRDWDMFYSLVHEDKPNQPIVDWMNYLIHDGKDVRIVTGRPERCRDATLLWLSEHTDFVRLPPYGEQGLNYSASAEFREAIQTASKKLYMRPDKLWIKSYRVKNAAAVKILAESPDNRLVLAVDDDVMCLAMYREYGARTAMIEQAPSP